LQSIFILHFSFFIKKGRGKENFLFSFIDHLLFCLFPCPVLQHRTRSGIIALEADPDEKLPVDLSTGLRKKRPVPRQHPGDRPAK
jgi:hypothetical protein